MEIKKMKAGRKLNILISKRIFGEPPLHGFLCPKCFKSDMWHTWDAIGPQGSIRHCDHCRWAGPASEAPPDFSGDVSAAWSVVKKFINKGTQRGAVGVNGDWFSWSLYWDGLHGEASAETMPLAICRAALMAVERLEEEKA